MIILQLQLLLQLLLPQLLCTTTTKTNSTRERATVPFLVSHTATNVSSCHELQRMENVWICESGLWRRSHQTPVTNPQILQMLRAAVT